MQDVDLLWSSPFLRPLILVSGPCVKADWTVTFVALKNGFLRESATHYTGVIWISDIGIPQKWLMDWSQRNGGSEELIR